MKHLGNQFDDRQLDDLLKKYGKAEPRTGLEQRMLAHLAEKRAESTNQSWRWQWVVAAVTAGVITGIAMLAVLKPTPHDNIVTNQPPIIVSKGPGITNNPTVRRPRILIRPRLSSQQKVEPTVEPCLDQFPSPAPLNEQEEMLARYVQSRHSEAVLVARARAVLEKESLERFAQIDSE